MDRSDAGRRRMRRGRIFGGIGTSADGGGAAAVDGCPGIYGKRIILPPDTPAGSLPIDGEAQKNGVGQALLTLAQELESQISPDVNACVHGMLCKVELPKPVQEAFCQLGTSLGRFDLDGQLKGLGQVQDFCRRELENLSLHREERLRSYQTLGLCAGAALAILFI